MVAMGNKLRDQAAGIHHVCNHAIEGAPLFADADDYLRRLGQLSEAVRDGDTVCHAYCLIGTHEHLLLGFEDNAIARVMQKLNRNYAVAFNGRHGRKGHTFDARYFNKRVESDAHLLQTFRYIALNPEHHGAGRAEIWPWSSYPSLIGLRPRLPFVDPWPIVAAFGPGVHPPGRIRDFVAAGRVSVEPVRRAA
jgi:hypothetical protein